MPIISTRHRALPFAFALALVSAAHAQQVAPSSGTEDGDTTANTAAQPGPCASPEHRQFDFWLGQWEVIGGPKLDRIVGRNTIANVATGCALREHWVNADGRDGHSLNAYDRQTRRWTQFWIGSDGVVLRLEGGLREDGAMAMEGMLANGKGGWQRQRLVWTPKPDGSVVQRWETSDDEGANWAIGFVGVYRRHNESE